MIGDPVERPGRRQWMNWRPESLYDALCVLDNGGPFVDHETGEVIYVAQLRPENWSALVKLPPDADPIPFDSPEEALAAAGRGPRGSGPRQLGDLAAVPDSPPVQPTPAAERDVFARALAAA